MLEGDGEGQWTVEGGPAPAEGRQREEMNSPTVCGEGGEPSTKDATRHSIRGRSRQEDSGKRGGRNERLPERCDQAVSDSSPERQGGGQPGSVHRTRPQSDQLLGGIKCTSPSEKAEKPKYDVSIRMDTGGTSGRRDLTMSGGGGDFHRGREGREGGRRPVSKPREEGQGVENSCSSRRDRDRDRGRYRRGELDDGYRDGGRRDHGARARSSHEGSNPRYPGDTYRARSPRSHRSSRHRSRSLSPRGGSCRRPHGPSSESWSRRRRSPSPRTRSKRHSRSRSPHRSPKRKSPPGPASAPSVAPILAYPGLPATQTSAPTVSVTSSADLVMSMMRGPSGVQATSGLTREQKVQLLWGSKKLAVEPQAAGSASGLFGANRWDTAEFENQEQKNRFQRLMGVKAPAAQAAPVNPSHEVDVDVGKVLGKSEQQKLFHDVEEHFVKGLRRADGRTVGLGL